VHPGWDRNHLSDSVYDHSRIRARDPDGPYFGPRVISPKFDDFSTARGLHVFDEVSAISFSIDDNAVRLQAKTDSGGAFDVEVDRLSPMSRDPIFANFVPSSLKFGRTCPGFKTTKELTLDIDRGRIWAVQEALCFTLDVLGLIHSFPEVEDVTLRGLPPRDLSIILDYLRGDPEVELPCPNIRRLCIGSIPLHSPRSLLVGLDKLLTERKRAGEPLRSLTVKVKCEMLIPAADHCAFLTSWEGLVEGDVRLEYERSTVKKLPRCRNYEDEDDWGDGREDDEGECEEVGVSDPDDSCVGWDGWPEKWPKMVGERGQAVGAGVLCRSTRLQPSIIMTVLSCSVLWVCFVFFCSLVGYLVAR